MTNFVTLNINDTEYNLRLTARACINLEKELGKNPISIFTGLKDGELPKISDIIAIIHASIQFKHTIDETCDIIDKYLEDNSMTDLINLTLEIFKASGFIRNEKN